MRSLAISVFCLSACGVTPEPEKAKSHVNTEKSAEEQDLAYVFKTGPEAEA